MSEAKRSKRYEFFESGYYRDRLTVRITNTQPGTLSRRTSQHHELTPSTYRRFVRLANSGRYDVAISDDVGDSITWELAR